jgi:uncharacterized protein (DUF362 family)
MGDTNPSKRERGLWSRIRSSAFIIGLLSLVWFVFRTGRKPSRASYPCQRAAALNAQIWLATYVLPVLSATHRKIPALTNRVKGFMLVAAILSVSVAAVILYRPVPPETDGEDEAPTAVAETPVGAALEEQTAALSPASEIFVVGGTTGGDEGVTKLIDLLGTNGLPFYETTSIGKNQSPDGLIAADDIVLIKVNCQWAERGGTNTDLLKALIQAVLDHPEGFSGEIVVADNGQAQYGSLGRGGSFSWASSNAEDRTQSVQRVVDSFEGHRVSAYLWDTITTTRVEEYSEWDARDGFVVNATRDPTTGIMVSYPKFKTEHGTHVSFKHGIWNPETETYDGERLKVLNVPVLKSHSGYGVTACVKHYMGVPSDKLTTQLGASTHSSVGRGGMGTLMAETRFPTLNILDCIWVNANPPSGRAGGAGPSTPYNRATRVNVIAASTDPVALDYWASKNILLRAAPSGSNPGAMDPDRVESGSFGLWLRLSMDEIVSAGYQATVNEEYMNVYVSR